MAIGNTDIGWLQKSMFDETEFSSACKELNQPDTDGYDFFTESLGVKIYRQYDEVNNCMHCFER